MLRVDNEKRVAIKTAVDEICPKGNNAMVYSLIEDTSVDNVNQMILDRLPETLRGRINPLSYLMAFSYMNGTLIRY